MATPTPAAQPPTRQQLDEIDALLRRMLTLPPLAAEPAGEPATPAAPPSAAPPVEMTFPAPVVREVPAPRPPAPEDPVVREWRVQWPQAAAREPSVVAWGLAVPLATLAEEPLAPDPAPATVLRAPVHQPSPFPPPPADYPLAEAVLPGRAPAPARAHVPPALWPLIGANALLTGLSYLVGPVGAWMRGPGRNALGWAGIAMLLTAGVWAAGEWCGYEWPKVTLDLSRLGLSP